MAKKFYATTAIDYVNGHPHLGHAYEKVMTDVLVRSRRAEGKDTYYLTGLDEHGQKVQQAARDAGMDPQAYCDDLATAWTDFTRRLQLSNDDFIRTSEKRHKEVVQAILDKLNREGHFYTAEYKGYYSARQETFLTDRDRNESGEFDEIYGDVVELSETNYYFRLGCHQQWLIDYIEANPDFIYPDYRRNEVLGFLRNNELEDLCITRPASRLNWGIPLPFDPDYVTYVWFDALTNYISAPASHGDPVICDTLGLSREGLPGLELWPADHHVIGKDIIKFHSVYWPIMLKAMGLPLPKQIIAHGWWQKEGRKISKTTGNIVDPVAVIEEWGLDAFRFYCIRELDLGPDGNWTDSGFESRYSGELANGLGNLVNRSLSMLKRYRQSVVPPVHGDLEEEASAVIDQTRAHYENLKFQSAVQSIWSLVTRVNQYIDQTAPFKLAKDPEQSGRLGEILYNTVESVRIIAVLLQPLLPDTAGKIADQLAIGGQLPILGELRWGQLPEGHVTGSPSPLFPRRDLRN
jgi:methionyl-tRNA synthetase